jgi:hypothetical protein
LEALSNCHRTTSHWVRNFFLHVIHCLIVVNVSNSVLFIGEKSPETIALRKKISDGCEKLVWDFFESGGQVVIYDANNGSTAVRNAIAERFDKAGIHVAMLGMCPNESKDFSFILPQNPSVITRRSSKEISEASRSPLPMYVHLLP